MGNQLSRKNKELWLRIAALVFLDALIILVSMVGALWIRYDFSLRGIDANFMESVYRYLLINEVCTILFYALMRLYSSLWRFAGLEETRNIIVAVLLSTLLQYCGMGLLSLPVPRSYPFLYMMLLFCLTLLCRFAYRIGQMILNGFQIGKQKDTIRTMVVGAGEAGRMIVREMKNSERVRQHVLCIIDDDKGKVGSYLNGIPVVGTKETIPSFVEKYKIDEIDIAIPTLTAQERKDLLEICQNTGCKIQILPGLYQLVNKEITVSMLQEVQIEDLLGREPVQMKVDAVMAYVKDKVVLVTGGGGSIGSEICRQIALYQPKQLIILDIYENNAYDIQNELKKRDPRLNLLVLIGSVRNQKRVDTIFETYHPDLVFHAAAHKHVPLMEGSPNEAVKNNVLGTWVVAHAADVYGAKKMVLISTDKAVRPTNIMGASKRVCELIVQSFAQNSETEYAAVRFGNVLGSNGSVVPLFRRQIEEGGPVTVTHPDVIRYFMTIPEAVNLVLQCGTLAGEGEIFILDMGEPVKILDLAKKMIRLSGHVPEKDIEIVFTGLRPGEKLYEELLTDEDNLVKTVNEKIFVVQPERVDAEYIQTTVRQMVDAAFDETQEIRELIRSLVPEYVPRTEADS